MKILKTMEVPPTSTSRFIWNHFYFQLITTTFKYTLRSTSVRYSLVSSHSIWYDRTITDNRADSDNISKSLKCALYIQRADKSTSDFIGSKNDETTTTEEDSSHLRTIYTDINIYNDLKLVGNSTYEPKLGKTRVK